MSGLCYLCDRSGAIYEAHLDYDCTPVVQLCEDCAHREREWGSIVWIRRNLRPEGELATVRGRASRDH